MEIYQTCTAIRNSHCMWLTRIDALVPARHHKKQLLDGVLNDSVSAGGHSFGTYAKSSEKLTCLTL